MSFLTAFACWGANHEKLSDFEKSIVNIGLENNNLIIDKNPSRKTIRNFYFYTQGPFDPTDKLLAWLDHTQFRTRDIALKNQLWAYSGEKYREQIIIENERILLNPAVRTFVLIFPVQKANAISESDVDLLIVSKDIFNWQLTYNLSGSGSNLTQFSLGLAQTNLFGLNKTVGINAALDQALLNLSAYYFDPSLFSSKNQLTLQQGVVLDRHSGHYEGVNGSMLLTYPLMIETVRWGYSAAINYSYQPIYDFQGDKLRLYEGQARQYHQFQIVPNLTLTRSFGTTYKNNLSAGFGLNLGKYEALEPVTEDFIKRVLPRNELQSYLIFGYNYFQNKFIALYNYNTFAMTEWQQLGASINFVNHVGLRFLGSDFSFYRPGLALGQTFALGKDSIVSLIGSGQTRIQDGLLNNQASTSLTAVLPTIAGVGRFVLSGLYSNIWNNQNNLQSTLGVSTGLRGVPFRYYQGTQLLRTNLEFRTVSLPAWILRLGLDAFYDFGAAFSDQTGFNPSHDVGLGLRILVVPWNRVLLRIDAAVPVAGPFAGMKNTLVSFGLGQAF
ncbi:MAG: hypothetical protein V4534_03445 [Myxococcota bacterium]